MTNAQLAELLNQEFDLSGTNAITANVIRQWVLWGVLPKACIQGKLPNSGPQWVREPSALRSAKRLTYLRVRGIRGEHALIAQAYLEWGHPDFDRVRTAFHLEFQRIRRQLRKRLTSDTNFDNFADLSPARRKALQNQSGNLDASFVGTKFQQSQEFYLTSLNMAVTGQGTGDQFSNLIKASSQQLFPEHGLQLAEKIEELLTPSITGFMGDPDEISNSIEENIINASMHDFRRARIAFRRTKEIHKIEILNPEAWTNIPEAATLLSEFDRLEPQISIGRWAISGFVSLLKIAGNSDRTAIKMEEK
jgi:hypothetical protein